MNPKILIVGAGPSGLSLALELARQGIVPDIIDKKLEPSTLSRAAGIIPVTMKLLEASGVTADLKKESIVIERVIFHDEEKEIIDLKVDKIKDSSQRLFVLPQDRTEAILTKHFEEFGGELNYAANFESCKEVDGKISVVINGQESFYDYIVGADGSHSQVREAAAIDFPGYELDDDWSIADIYIEDSHYNHNFNIYIKDQSKVTLLLPLEAKRLRIISNTANALENLDLDLKISNIKREANFKIEIRQAVNYRKGGIFLIGDAAHCHSPVGGRGMNLGIADAVDLARCFVNNDLESYNKNRHKVARKIINQTEFMRKAMLSKNNFLREITLSIFKLASKNSFVNKIFLEKVLLAPNTV